jgi:hypothetical protein
VPAAERPPPLLREFSGLAKSPAGGSSGRLSPCYLLEGVIDRASRSPALDDYLTAGPIDGPKSIIAAEPRAAAVFDAR